MDRTNILINTSILYRSSSKFYDKKAMKYDFGYGQLIFLLLIYENEGISMQALANKGCFDKGTITKSIQRLEELEYVRTVNDDKDKRVKLLYTTDKVEDIIADLYLMRREWWEIAMKDLSTEETAQFESLLSRICENARTYEETTNDDLKIFGLQKTTLLDYPGKLAATVFTGGCNLRCPFCQNSQLVFMPENMTRVSDKEILSYLEKRANLLEGVCISGGEPLLQSGLEDFLIQIKELGLSIKLDTNGFFPERLKHLVDANLIDYVAVDIKNCKEEYARTSGLENIDISKIEETVTYLLENHIPYEFRTTVVKEYHDEECFKAIGKWIKGAQNYYLQNFVDSEFVIQKGLTNYSKEELEHFKEILADYIPNVSIRGL